LSKTIYGTRPATNLAFGHRKARSNNPAAHPALESPSLQRSLKFNPKRGCPSFIDAGILGLASLAMGSKRCINQIDEHSRFTFCLLSGFWLGWFFAFL
jgi:hypothetical protein